MQSNNAILRPLLFVLLLIAVCIVLFYGRAFLMPLTFGGIFAFLVNPIDRRIIGYGVNKYISAIMSVVSILIVVSLLLSVLGWQIEQVTERSDEIKKELIQIQQRGQEFVKHQFGITLVQQEQYAEEAFNSLKDNIGTFIGSTAGIFVNFFLSLIYAILLLSEKKRIQAFFYRITQQPDSMENTIEETSEVIQSYLIGKLIIIAILATVYSVGFLIAGINYAILIAVLAAFLSFIPYAGNIIGGSIAILITLATGGSMTEAFIIFVVIGSAQVIESYILEPWIVGSNVDLNPLFSILAVIGLGMIWGAGGAIIALPLVGTLKVLFSNWKSYQPLGFLMGDEEITTGQENGSKV